MGLEYKGFILGHVKADQDLCLSTLGFRISVLDWRDEVSGHCWTLLAKSMMPTGLGFGV